MRVVDALTETVEHYPCPGQVSNLKTQKQHPYHSYLLRLWQDSGCSRSQWRASLESVETRDMFHFASLETLFAFLRRQVTSQTCNEEYAVDPEE
jgi:hypothetical protein